MVFLPLPVSGASDELLAYMVEDAGAAIVLGEYQKSPIWVTSANYLSYQDITKSNNTSQHSFSSVKTEQPVCIFYTSGSTGKPKGVLIPFSGLISRLPSSQINTALTHADTYLWKSSVGFSSIIREIFWALFSGATTVIVPAGKERDIETIVRVALENNVSVMHLVPSQFRALIQIEAFKKLHKLRHVVVGGETVGKKLPSLFHAQTKAVLHQIYGSTEATTATHHTFNRFQNEPSTRIGRKANLNYFVLDDNLSEIAAGSTGEIFVAGPGIALGYVNNAKLTDEKFIKSDLNKHGDGRLYKTGDYVRKNDDGTLDFVGRVDHQIKIRGHRIELRAVNRIFESLDFVQSSETVVLGEPDEAYLSSYFILEEGLSLPSLEEIRTMLLTDLSEYMLPTYFIPVKHFPLNSIGKLDISKLVETNKNPIRTHVEMVQPGNNVERLLSSIWKTELKLENLGIEDNFFTIGGNSLSAISITREISEKTGLELDLEIFFNNPTVAALATAIGEKGIYNNELRSQNRSG